MKPSQATQEKHLHAMIAHMPVAATFGEQTVNCNRTVLGAEDIAAAAGELEGYEFSLHSVISDWEPLPINGDVMTVSSVEHRILRSHADQVAVRWDLGNKYAERQA